MERAEHGITVNAYRPGLRHGHVGRDRREARRERGPAEGEAIRKYCELLTLGRIEEPEDVAGYVSYLTSHDSDYMVGRSVMIDGIQFLQAASSRHAPVLWIDHGGQASTSRSWTSGWSTGWRPETVAC